MSNVRLALMLAALAALLPGTAASAAQPAPEAYLPAPPGTVVQNETVYLTGDGNFARWQAVVSKKLLGKANGRAFYQWYLSIYADKRGAYRLRYQSPGNGGPLSTVTPANGAKLWFPVQDVRIVGAGTFMQPGVQELVVRSHEMSADCGAAAVSVFASGPGGGVVPAVSAGNLCDLNATIEHNEGGDVIHLSGPYYAANAAACCPTNANARAGLTYQGGKWVQTPTYFKLYVGKLPPN